MDEIYSVPSGFSSARQKDPLRATLNRGAGLLGRIRRPIHVRHATGLGVRPVLGIKEFFSEGLSRVFELGGAVLYSAEGLARANFVAEAFRPVKPPCPFS